MFRKIEIFLDSLSNKKLFLVLYFLKLLIYIGIVLILMLLGNSIDFSDYKLTYNLIYRKVLLPAFFETFLCQFLIIEILTKMKIKKNWIVVISGLVFALSHYQNIFYIIYEIPFGVFYAFTYIIYKERKALPFLMVFLIHFIWNLTMVLT